MDPLSPAFIAGAVAVVSLIVAVFAVMASRSALGRATAAALANRQALDIATSAAQTARQETAAAMTRVADVERRLLDSDRQLKMALQRASQLEERLAETEDRLRRATEVAPPPIPSGRRVARLDDLRATLRAQAAEAAENAESEAETAP